MNDQKQILICEDESDIAEILCSSLRRSGYKVESVASGEDLQDLFGELRPDLVLLDVWLPGMDGWSVLEWIRERSTCPIIMTTARTDVVRGLQGGADDYITKPFKLEELRARIEAVLRRATSSETGTVLHIDDARKVVTVGGVQVSISPKEYALIGLLASDPGRVFTPQEIIAALWPKDSYASAQDVQKYVYLLRKRLEKDPSNPELILTVRGFGYRLANNGLLTRNGKRV